MSAMFKNTKPGKEFGHTTMLLGGVSLAAVITGATPAISQDTGVIEEIVVTARQRTENLQEVPISMSAVTGTSLREARIDTLQEMEHSVPNLVFGETGTSGETHVGLRGIGDFSRNIGFDTRVGVFIDGVFAGQSLAVDQSLVDIAQIEVLRGPQGTLFGKNSSSGIINITTKGPDLGETSGEVQFGGGNLSNIYGSAVVNLPLGDRAAARFSFVAQDQDGYVRNLNNGKDLMSGNHISGRGRLRFQPSEALDVTVSFDIREQNNDILFLEPDASYELAAGDPAAVDPFVVNQDGPLIDRNDSWGLGLSADYDFGNGYVLTWITGYRTSDRRVGSDEDASPVYALHVKYFEDDIEHFTQEIRLASPEDKSFRYVVGGYYFTQDASQFRDVVIGPAFGAPADTLGGRSDSSVDTDAWAGFINANLDLNERLTISGGLRFTHEKKKADLNQFALAAFGLANFNDITDQFTDDNVTATANLQYAFSDDVNGYFTYSRGHKSGGWNVDFVGAVGDLPFDSESVDSFEAGIKSDLADGRLRLNITGFRAKYDDFQVFQFQFNGATTNLIVSNAASVVTKGVEIEGIARLTDNFEIVYGLGYADAEFDDFPGGATDAGGNPINVAGNALPRAPKLTTSLTARYSFMVSDGIDGALALTYNYRGEQFFNPDNLDRSRQAGYGMFNASLDININDRWGVAVWGKNIGDKTYTTMRGVSFLGVPFSLYAQPRIYGAEVTYRF